MSRRKSQPESFDVAEFLRESDADLKSALHTLLGSQPETNSGINLTDVPPPPGINLRPEIPGARHFPIRQMKSPEDAHSRAEQQVYESLWRNGQPADDGSRVITIGFGEMAKLVRLSESNARINVRSLIAKLAIEESGAYNCERSVGRTYRIFDSAGILRRRRQAGLLWYMRRTLAVVFVDPVTGQPIDLGVKRPRPKRSRTEPGPNLTASPGPKLPDDSAVYEALARYGPVDHSAVARLRTATARICPDFTDEELVHFIRLKGDFIQKRKEFLASPIGFLLTAVPKCFAGEDFEAYRKARRDEEEEIRRWYREQQAILEDPNSSEEDRKWAEKVLFRG
jgi:hypothetical protein